jgi:1,4-alpha-glucan branching enzyme
MKNIVFLFVAILYFGCNSPKNKIQHQCSNRNMSDITSEAHFPEWSANATIYEVNVRQYTPEGTFAAFAKHLPRLQELGVKILWFMPIHPISEKNRKGTLGSYYAVQDYKKVNPEFGTFEDFKALVEKAHSMGFKVILDWVANHTGWDGPWIENNPEWFTKDSLGQIVSPVEDWSDVADLNYDVPEMRAAMIDALKFWVSEANIDGYRCDVAGMVPTDFWEDARAALTSIKPVFMLAEDESETDLLINAFNMNYGWGFHHLMNEIAQGKAGATEVKNWVTTHMPNFPAGSYPMHFTSNHDENSWNGTEYERLGNAVKTMAALTFMLPGMPLIYSGQEAALNKRLAFFEKDEIDWNNLNMQKFYQQLVQLKKDNEALWNGCAGADIYFADMEVSNDLLVFIRSQNKNKVMSIFNLSDQLVKNTFVDKKCAGKYTDTMNDEKIKISVNDDIEVDPWEFIILVEE